MMLSAVQMARPWAARPAAPAPGIVRLFASGASLAVAAGDKIYAEGAEATFVYQVRAGCARSLSLSRDGRRTIQDFYLPGEIIFGVEHDGVHVSTAEAVCDSGLMRCEKSRLLALADTDAAAAAELWSWLLLARDQTAERLGRLARGSAFDKVIYFLLDMASRTAGGARIELPMSRYDIADYLGLSSETVSRTFTALRQRGLIQTEGRMVVLLETRKLRACSGLAEPVQTEA